MIKTVFLFLLIVITTSCSNIQLVLDDKPKTNFLKNNSSIFVSGKKYENFSQELLIGGPGDGGETEVVSKPFRLRDVRFLELEPGEVDNLDDGRRRSILGIARASTIATVQIGMRGVCRHRHK